MLPKESKCWTVEATEGEDEVVCDVISWVGGGRV